MIVGRRKAFLFSSKHLISSAKLIMNAAALQKVGQNLPTLSLPSLQVQHALCPLFARLFSNDFLCALALLLTALLVFNKRQ
jgi:hypothetical protein